MHNYTVINNIRIVLGVCIGGNRNVRLPREEGYGMTLKCFQFPVGLHDNNTRR